MIERLPDWEQRLHALIVERECAGFLWGTHDCALWGADAVLALTGQDFGASFRGQYDDADSAALALREFGRGTIVRTYDAALPRRSTAMLRRGDIAMIRRGLRGSVGVVVGNDALFVGDLGLEPRPRPLWSRGWGVG